MMGPQAPAPRDLLPAQKIINFLVEGVGGGGEIVGPKLFITTEANCLTPAFKYEAGELLELE